MAKTTPMMEQYRAIKSANPDSILLFRLGDFYEMFEEDAKESSRVLNITLTSRNGTPMCGFPFHASQAYIGRLLKAGKKIAICEQTEDPASARGIVRREVVEIMSPGIITNPDFLDSGDHNAIGALYAMETAAGAGAPHRGGGSSPGTGPSSGAGSFSRAGPSPGTGPSSGAGRLAFAGLDVSTGDFTAARIEGSDRTEALLNELDDAGIRELIYPEDLHEHSWFAALIERLRSLRSGLVCRPVSMLHFSPRQAEQALRDQYEVSHAGVMELPEEAQLVVCGALLGYVRENVKQDLDHLKWVRQRRDERILFVDNTTKKHLELTESSEGMERATLLAVLDRTRTAMGKRLLRHMVNNPSRDLETIETRLDRVQTLFDDPQFRERIRSLLAGVLDIERIVSKLTMGKGSGRDLVGLKSSLELAALIREATSGRSLLEGELPRFGELTGLVGRAVVDDPPQTVREGGIIREGYNQELDSLRNAGRENREWINRYQATEQQRLGISSLKVRYNRVIGFFIEVTKPNIHLVDGKYIKKQTLVNAERFTTQELEEHEALLSEARGRADELEYRLFDELRSRVLEHRGQLYIASSMLAQLDVYCSLAYAARENGYVRPVMTGENRLLVREGRHPVVELVVEEEFIGNDLELDDTERRIMILTGPNMSGKSTYLRQNALIVIMAHLGSFVPAREASIGLVDRVFSRIGASDRLARGESTFLVEMIETARILHYATERSFVIMDEIGRGTSTYDGLAIAWAVLEHLLRNKKVKTLFATHYHEITAMRDSGVVNCNVAVREYNGRVLFLRRVLPGSASRSYGVEVARMAGVPEGVIKRARYLLSTLEMKYGGHVALLGEAAGPAGSDGPGETVGPDTRKPDGPGETVGPDTRKPNEGPGGVSAKQAGSDEESSGPAGQAGTGDESSGAAKQESVDGSGGGQYDLFPSPYEVLIQELRDVDVNAITPLEALNILDRLKKSMSF